MVKKYRCDKTIDLENWIETREMTDEELAKENKLMRETVAQMRLLLKTHGSWNRTKH
tara:strand:+ start:465 stop:635 length:171 start_codon:yes stop_codon:yes gene_type:complete